MVRRQGAGSGGGTTPSLPLGEPLAGSTTARDGLFRRSIFFKEMEVNDGIALNMISLEESGLAKHNWEGEEMWGHSFGHTSQH